MEEMSLYKICVGFVNRLVQSFWMFTTQSLIRKTQHIESGWIIAETYEKLLKLLKLNN